MKEQKMLKLKFTLKQEWYTTLHTVEKQKVYDTDNIKYSCGYRKIRTATSHSWRLKNYTAEGITE